MKKQLLTVLALVAISAAQAQIQTNNGTATGATNSNVMLDGSSSFSAEAGAQPNVGKGIIVPSVDLVNFAFDLSLADGITFPTYFDGMIVYNRATGSTLTTGNRPSASLAVTPGFYYFSNPNGAANGNVTGGTWKALGGSATGDNLGNHTATQNLLLGSNQLKFGNVVDNKKIILYENAADDNNYYGFGISSATLRYQVPAGGNHTFYAATSATTSNELFKVQSNGEVFAANNIYSAGQVYAGTNAWFRVRGNTGIYWQDYDGGWFMQDTTYMRTYNEKSIYTGVGSILTSTGTIQAGSGIGSAKLIPGGPSNSGYVGIFRANNTRLGYIGFDNNNLSYSSENGANHVFSGGSIYADNQIYSGINQWFRVRGSGTGVYWENFGGGWYMDETSTIKSVNSKNIYTGGAITAGSDIVGNAQVYAGINQYFRVRGDGGFYFDNYGGGWNMTDTTWIRAMNNKNIYTGGVGRFDTRVETARVQGTSDKRFKKDIAKIYDATEKLNQLNGYTYTWRDKKEFPGQPLGEGRDMGVIAQEVEKVFPDAVMTNKEGYKSVNYNALIPVLIESLKEAHREIKELKKQIGNR